MAASREGPPDASRFRAALAELPPATFALVMATGIVSIDCELAGRGALAEALLWANVGFYVALWVLFVLRAALFPRRFAADLADHARGVGAFTVVAGTCVLGADLLLVRGAEPAAAALWVLGAVLWVLLTYGVLTTLTVRAEKPALTAGLNGGWLLPVVATQGLVVLGSGLVGRMGARVELGLFALLALWLGGGMLYFWIISLVFYRYTFFPMSPADLTPPYWINMGAAAITALGGALLGLQAAPSPLLSGMLPFVKGFTLLFWASATWWIPMLVLLGLWRHGLRRFPLRYHPLYWGAVFPLGMYAACTWRVAELLEVPSLVLLPRAFLWIALGAWALTFAGLLGHLARILRPA